MAEKGKSGKFFTEALSTGKANVPKRMKEFPRQHCWHGKKRGRRDYPWRKQKKVKRK